MAKRIVDVTFEIDSQTGKVAIIRRSQVPIKKRPGEHREVIDRYHLGFLLPKGQKPKASANALHAIIFGQLGMGAPELGK